jgi:hypothetical protein
VSILLNKDLRPLETTLFLNKLDTLLEKLRVQYEAGFFETQEDVIEEFNRAIEGFYASLKTPILKLRPVREGTPPSFANYNLLFGDVERDLRVIFKEVDTLERMILRNFNYMVSERDKVNKLLKRVSSKVGDYVLYSDDPIGGAIYFKDSFNDTSKTDFGSELLKEPQCEIYQAEGIVTLPIIREGSSVVSNVKVKINEEHSNGSSGNYQELGAAPHDELRDVLDSNPDTWFEYERVQRTRSVEDESLKLDLTLYFDQPQVVNFIRINPNNFGTQTPVVIKSIDTSFDGAVWVSVKDDIPIAGFLQEDEEDIFTLAPSTSKFAGQGLYTFTPRKVKYIRLLLEQVTPYLIDTPGGEQWRYAIGIRDIELQAIKYQTKGDIISQSFSSVLEIQKVSVLASENPFEASELADVLHQVSPDDGASWYSIQPQDRSGTEIPEILSFNTADENAISTPSPVYTLRHRMTLSRETDAFVEGSSTFRRTVKSGMDILTLPLVSPVTVTLTRPPVAGSLVLMNPLWGARSQQGDITASKQVLGLSNGQPGMRLTLPQEITDKIKSGDIGFDEVKIWVDNDSRWLRAPNDWTDVGRYDRVYILDTSGDNGIIQFGKEGITTVTDGILDAVGAVPAGGSVISFTLTEEQLHPSVTPPHTCDLIFTTDGEKPM